MSCDFVRWRAEITRGMLACWNDNKTLIGFFRCESLIVLLLTHFCAEKKPGRNIWHENWSQTSKLLFRIYVYIQCGQF